MQSASHCRATETQLRNQIRLTLIKLREYNSLGESFEVLLRKLITVYHLEPLDLLCSKILALEIKSEYQTLIIMTFVSQLFNIIQTQVHLHNNSVICQKIESVLLAETSKYLLADSVSNKEVSSYFYLKKMEIVKAVLCAKIKLTDEFRIEHFITFYNTLKTCQNTSSNTIKEHYKLTFVEIHKTIFEQTKDEAILGYVFNELMQDSIRAIEAGSKDSSTDSFEWMRILDTRLLCLQNYLTGLASVSHSNLAKITFMLVKSTNLNSMYVSALTLGLGDLVLNKLLTTYKLSPLMHILISHLVVNPLSKQLANPTDLLYIQTLLAQVIGLIKNKQLLFGLLRVTDLNLHAEDLIYPMITSLYEYLEKQEKKQYKSFAFEPVKRTVKAVMDIVKDILDKRSHNNPINTEIEQKIKFYHLKEKEYQAMVAKFNVDEKISLKNFSTDNEYQIEKFVRFLRKSPHIISKRMIEVLGLPSPISQQLRTKYVESFRMQNYSIQEAFRIFLSNFFLIGQTQQIERIIEAFSLHYMNTHKTNLSKDSQYVYITAILFLNTDLYNPNNQRKMTEEGWLKFCSGIEGAEKKDLLEIYKSVSSNKIQNFRNLNNLYNINLCTFMYNYAKYSENIGSFWTLAYIDEELKDFQYNSLVYRHLSYEILEGVLVGKEVDKINKLVDTFIYREDVYECEILEVLKVLENRGKIETPYNVLKSIANRINFFQATVDEKSLSYYWLISKIINQHFQHIPIEYVCRFLISTSKERKFIEDDMYTRIQLKVKRLREIIRIFRSKQLKKNGSLMDIFSNFLGERESSDDQFRIVNDPKKSIPFKKLSLEIHENIIHSKEHRIKAAQFFSNYLINEESRVPFQTFLTTLYLLLDVVYLSSDRDCVSKIDQILDIIINKRDCTLTKRLAALKANKSKHYELIQILTKYYCLRIMLEYPELSQRYAQYFEDSTSFLEICTIEFLKQFIPKLKSLNHLDYDIISKCRRAILANVAANPKHSQEQEIREYVEEIKRERAIRQVMGDILSKVVTEAETQNSEQQKASSIVTKKEQIKDADVQKQSQQSPTTPATIQKKDQPAQRGEPEVKGQVQPSSAEQKTGDQAIAEQNKVQEKELPRKPECNTQKSDSPVEQILLKQQGEQKETNIQKKVSQKDQEALQLQQKILKEEQSKLEQLLQDVDSENLGKMELPIYLL